MMMNMKTGIGFRTSMLPFASNPSFISTFSPISSAPFTSSLPLIFTPSPI